LLCSPVPEDRFPGSPSDYLLEELEICPPKNHCRCLKIVGKLKLEIQIKFYYTNRLQMQTQDLESVWSRNTIQLNTEIPKLRKSTFGD